ncbi:MAG: SGNH/GDSL hydrolase family protein [Actinomycetota bacterium]
MNRRRDCVVMAVVLTSIVAGCGDDDPDVVAIYGDSLSAEAQPYLEMLAGASGRELEPGFFWGTAPCDWVDDIEQRTPRDEPVAIVMAFAGNNVTPCTDGATGTALADQYERDVRRGAVAATSAGAHVVLVGPPDMDAPLYREHAPLIRARMEDIADELADVEFVDGRELLSPDGFAPALPCREDFGEDAAHGCTDGEIVVRHEDGVHFDPPGPDGFSAGANRWARTLLSGFEDRSP